MALSGTFGKTVNTRWRLQADWSAVQNISGNSSNITLNLYWMGLDQYATTVTSATKDGSITINGNAKTFSGAGLAKLTGSQKKLIASHVISVPHASDGTKSVALSAFFDAELDLNGYVGRISIDSTVTLNTIPRTSTLSSSPSWTMFGTLPISITRASASFTHTVKIQAGTTNVPIKEVGNVGTSTSVAFSLEEHTKILQQMNGAGTTPVKISLSE